MVYNEVDALSTLLGYQVQNAGCCKVVFHPTWGSSVYPSTLFAIAPEDEVPRSRRTPPGAPKTGGGLLTTIPCASQLVPLRAQLLDALRAAKPALASVP